jgi:hypothetical protein
MPDGSFFDTTWLIFCATWLTEITKKDWKSPELTNYPSSLCVLRVLCTFVRNILSKVLAFTDYWFFSTMFTSLSGTTIALTMVLPLVHF